MMTEPQACARCGREIPAERMEAVPETRVCVKCAQAMGGSDFISVVVAEKTSKEGSLKKNYGSYHTKKIPKLIRPIEE